MTAALKRYSTSKEEDHRVQKAYFVSDQKGKIWWRIFRNKLRGQMKKINNAEKVAPVQPLSLIPFLAKSGAKRKVKSWKALLIRTLSTNVFIYMIASATKN